MTFEPKRYKCVDGKLVSIKGKSYSGPTPEHIRSIRERTGKSRDAFSQELGVSPRTLQSWEQGQRHPSSAAISLLRLIRERYIVS